MDADDLNRIRQLIKDTYANMHWWRPKNFLWAITHFGILCRYAAVGLKLSVFFLVNYNDLERYRKEKNKRRHDKDGKR